MIKTGVTTLCLFIIGLTSSQETNGKFTAAVVEYSTLQIKGSNTGDYLRIINETLSTNTTIVIDLIVFPEATLNENATYVPSANESLVLCNNNSNSTNYADYLKQLSCAAIGFNVGIVVNLLEKIDCTTVSNNCTSTNSLIYYNTNVVFDDKGTIVAVYRKWNLFGEQRKSRPPSLEVVSFKLKNITFGTFICFDIMFAEPALNLTRQNGIRHIIFPTMWFSELPFLTAVQTQQMWAQENDVVLLAAGANRAAVGSYGSGIYVGSDGALETEVNGEDLLRVIVKEVPNLDLVNASASRNVTNIEETVEQIDAAAVKLDTLNLLTDPSIKDYNSITLNTTESGTTVQQVCHGSGNSSLCCDFNITVSVSSVSQNVSQYVYHMVAFNGVRTFGGVRDGGIETCAVIACLNSAVSSCGTRFGNYSEINWPVTFDQISVTANYTDTERRIQFPNSLLASLKPIPAQSTQWSTDTSTINGTVIRTHKVDTKQSRLLAFGIYGRDFSRDTERAGDTDGNSGTRSTINPLLAFIVILAYNFLYLKF